MRKNKEKIKEYILNVAEAFFFTYGFEKISMNKLAVELGISKKTIYKHFSSKEELIIEILDRQYYKAELFFNEITQEKDMLLIKKIKAVIKYKIDIFSKIMPPFLRDVHRNPFIQEKAAKVIKEIIPITFGVLFDQGKEEGIVRKSIDTGFVSMMLFNSVDTMLEPENLKALNLTTEEAIEEIFRIVLHGILTNSGN